MAFFDLSSRIYPTNPLKNPDGYYSQPSYIVNLAEGGRQNSNNDNAILTGEFVIRPLPGWILLLIIHIMVRIITKLIMEKYLFGIT